MKYTHCPFHLFVKENLIGGQSKTMIWTGSGKNMKRPKLWYVTNDVPLPTAWEKCEKSATWYIVNVFQKVSVEKSKTYEGQTKNNVLCQIDWRKAKKEKIHRIYDEYRKPNFPREIQASKLDEYSATKLP